MKRFLMLVGVAVVAAAMYVAAGTASQQSAGPTAKQFAALKKQVTTLSKTLKTTKKEADAALGFILDCIASQNAVIAPVSQFGDPNGTFGYSYTADGNTFTDRTALDIDTGATPEALLLGVDPACVSPAARHRASSGVLHGAIRTP